MKWLSAGKAWKVVLIALLWSLFGIAHGTDQQAKETGQGVHYEADTDVLRIQVREMPLEELLSAISLMTRIEVRSADNKESLQRRVSARIGPEPLEQALRRLARTQRLDHVLRWQGTGDDALLVGMDLLGGPEGSSLQSLVRPDLEAFSLARTRLDARSGTARDAPAILSLSEQRWQARLEELSEPERARVQALLARYVERLESRRQAHAERREEVAERRQGRRAGRAARDEADREADPDGWAREQQIREQARNRRAADLAADREPVWQPSRR